MVWDVVVVIVRLVCTVVVTCLLGKGAIEFVLVQIVLGADHNCIATCQISKGEERYEQKETISQCPQMIKIIILGDRVRSQMSKVMSPLCQVYIFFNDPQPALTSC